MVRSERPGKSQEFAIRRHLWPNYAKAGEWQLRCICPEGQGAGFLTLLPSFCFHDTWFSAVVFFFPKG